MKNELVILKVTYPDLERAKNFAEILLQKKLAACVQFTPIESMYFWRGKIENNHEILLSIKTKNSLLKSIEKIIKKHHDYEIPQMLSIQVDQGSKPYLNWINSCLKK